MNYDFINTLLELYATVPADSAEAAARRVAVLVEMEIRDLENSGEAITQETLLRAFKKALAPNDKAA
jgi:hypothetical protein